MTVPRVTPAFLTICTPPLLTTAPESNPPINSRPPFEIVVLLGNAAGVNDLETAALYGIANRAAVDVLLAEEADNRA